MGSSARTVFSSIGIASGFAGGFTGVLAAAGCHHEPQPLPAHIATTQTVAEKPLPAMSQATLIKQGQLPLAYLTISAASLRIVDLTSGAELARVTVAPRQILSIDETHGVNLNGQPIVNGPLATGHLYGIELDSAGGGSMQTTTIRPDVSKQ